MCLVTQWNRGNKLSNVFHYSETLLSIAMENLATPPPSTYNEWLSFNRIETWPIDPIQVRDKSWLDLKLTMPSLWKEIKDKASCRISILNDILSEVEKLEEKLNLYSTSFFETSADSSEAEVRGNINTASREKEISIEKEKYTKRREKINIKSRDIEFAIYPGFFAHEMTLLPGSLEAPQLLNNITKLQDFRSGFKKIWKQYFLSEASVSILQDTFWWLFLEQSKGNHKSTQSKLFDRLASNFISLFISIPFQVKDQFFKQYPNCLAQAVYSAFFVAFPLSALKFDLHFREGLVALIYEWVTGTLPHKRQILRTWKLEPLENQHLHDCLDEPLQIFKSNLSFDEETFLDIPGVLKEEVTDLKLSAAVDKESHPAGPGPDFNKVGFNVFGQSPFIKHFLSSKNLQKENEILNKTVTRTELNESKLVGCVTYNELVNDFKRKSKSKKKKYERFTSQISKDIQSCNDENKKEIHHMRKIQDELIMKHYDIKILSQKIMDMMISPVDVSNGKVFATNVSENKTDDS